MAPLDPPPLNRAIADNTYLLRAYSHDGLPLTDPDGGSRWRDQFRYAMRGDPYFFPIGIWGVGIDSAPNVAVDQAAGVNVYIKPYASSDLTLLAGTGMYAILQSAEWLSSYNSWKNNGAVVGHETYDEKDMQYNGAGGDQSQGIADQASIVASLPGDGRLVYSNYGKGVMFYGSDYWSRRYVNEFQDIVSHDTYWMTDTSIWGQYQGGKLVNGSTAALTSAQGRLGYNYGLSIKRLRSLVYPARSRPVWGFVELCSQGSSTGETISVAEIGSASWHQIIAGARGIELFPVQFDSSKNITDYNALRNQQTVRDGVTALTARIRSVAPALNAPSVTGFTTVPTGVAATVRYQGGCYWVIAGSRQTASQTATFTGLPAAYSGATVTVVGENRTITASGTSFSDTFADQNAVHIYKIA